jgi:predicted heme/steroid binding protein/uncharacterized membrane protein
MFKMEEERRFTRDELAIFDGSDGRPIYVAAESRVYDVTRSNLWVGGRHMGVHGAGNDLSGTLQNAPHDSEVLFKFPVVGVLIEDEVVDVSLSRKIANLYPHPIIAHFPIVLSTIAPLFTILFILTKEGSFELASYYILIMGFLASPICGLAGMFSWKVNYKGNRSSQFNKKILFTVVLVIVMTTCLVWRSLVPDVLVSMSIYSYVYLILQMSLALITGILGHTGGKIVFS